MKKNNVVKRVELAKIVIDSIKNGVINDEGDIREFDIVDYYQLVKISPTRLYDTTVEELRNELDEESMKVFRSFVLKSLNDIKNTVKGIMEVKHSVLVDGIVREITDEEKKSVLFYLKSNKIPLTANTYALTLRRYLNNELSMDGKVKELVKCP